jgi:tRNA A37 threonylcarbamoyladenosine dehydratase
VTKAIDGPAEGGAPAPPFSRPDAEPVDYATAFSRNLGWTTEWEQQALRARRVAIAGLGGVGGAHLLALARLGIGGFHIADLDRFDLA